MNCRGRGHNIRTYQTTRTTFTGCCSTSTYSSYGAYGWKTSYVKEPKTARCVFCKKDKPVGDFSEPQWCKAIYNLRASPGKTKPVTCKECTDYQTDKIACYTCTKLKLKTDFSKRQRRHGAQARCRDCVRKTQEEDPNDSEPNSASDDENIMEHPFDFV